MNIIKINHISSEIDNNKDMVYDMAVVVILMIMVIIIIVMMVIK